MNIFPTLSDEMRQQLLLLCQDKSSGYKIKRGKALFFSGSDKNTPYAKPSKLPKAYSLTHSLIKIGGGVFILGHGAKAKLGQGAYGRVKYVQNLKTKVSYVVKVEITKKNEYRANEIFDEENILQDVNIGLSRAHRRLDENVEKHYSLMRYMGRSLHDVLNDEQGSLSDNVRFDLAIKLCFEVYKLHSGLLSNLGIAYAHHDIKPANITVINTNDIHLVDFGISKANPDARYDDVIGAPAYMPMMRRFLNSSMAICRWQADMLALKRTLYFPKTLMCMKGLVGNDLDQSLFQSLLEIKGLEKMALFPFIDTGGTTTDKADSTLKPLPLAALIVLAKYQLPNTFYQSVAGNEKYAAFVMSAYFRQQEAPQDDFKAQLAEALTAYMGAEKVNESLKDNFLYTHKDMLSLLSASDVSQNIKAACLHSGLRHVLKSSYSQAQKRAFIHLFHLDCLHKASILLIKQKPELANIIITYCRKNKENIIARAFCTNIGIMMIRNLSSVCSLKEALTTLKNPPITALIAKSPSVNFSRVVYSLYKSNPKITREDLAGLILGQDKNDKMIANHKRVTAIAFLIRYQLPSLYAFALKENNHFLLLKIRAFCKTQKNEVLKERMIKQLPALIAQDVFIHQMTAFEGENKISLFLCLCLRDFSPSMAGLIVKNNELASFVSHLFEKVGCESEKIKAFFLTPTNVSVLTLLLKYQLDFALCEKVMMDKPLINQIHDNRDRIANEKSLLAMINGNACANKLPPLVKAAIGNASDICGKRPLHSKANHAFANNQNTYQKHYKRYYPSHQSKSTYNIITHQPMPDYSKGC